MKDINARKKAPPAAKKISTSSSKIPFILMGVIFSLHKYMYLPIPSFLRHGHTSIVCLNNYNHFVNKNQHHSEHFILFMLLNFPLTLKKPQAM